MSAAAFDRIAPRYDQLWTDTPAGRSQRAQVWRHIDLVFRPGESVLDVGCGTGADAAHLVARGISVHGIDSSPAMVEICLRANPGGLPCPALSATVLAAEQIATVAGVFDGALSNFGALNCIADLCPVVAGLAAKIRPGGRVAICTMGRFSAAETLGFAARLQFRKAIRRWRGTALSSLGAVHYHTVAELRAAFAPEFELERWTGIGRLPWLRFAADHRLLIFARK
jgi:ubiquinone/menaquinone biosynthesis C-methylase UbiE